MGKKILCFSFVISFLVCLCVSFSASEPVLPAESEAERVARLWETLDQLRYGETAASAPEFSFDLRSAVLMEASTGTVLYEYQKDERHLPASVTKVMTLLLTMEAIEAGQISEEDQVTASDYAASMGGTQIYLEVGEQMSVRDLIKSVAVPSANDAAVALAEYIAGSEQEFVRRMNVRAGELGMVNSNFNNCTGLFDDDAHVTSAYDIALATKELLKHPNIYDYTKIWMDSIRGGEFVLANTNKMLRTYSGMTGMKTGYTKQSLYCFSGTAERDGMTLIVAIMGAASSDARFSAAKQLLDYGFSNYAVARGSVNEIPPVTVVKGKSFTAPVSVSGSLAVVVPKGQESAVTSSVTMEPSVEAPVAKGTQVGVVTYSIKDKVLQTCPIVVAEDVPRAGFGDYLGRFFQQLLGKEA